MHGHAGITADGVDGHLWLDVGGLSIREVVAVGRLISVCRGHEDEESKEESRKRKSRKREERMDDGRCVYDFGQD